MWKGWKIIMANAKREKYLVESEIAIRKQLLEQSDYQALKHADGAMTDEEYEEIKEKRAKWRAEINELEEELSAYPDDEHTA
jgi:hypothetical protein